MIMCINSLIAEDPTCKVRDPFNDRKKIRIIKHKFTGCPVYGREMGRLEREVLNNEKVPENQKFVAFVQLIKNDEDQHSTGEIAIAEANARIAQQESERTSNFNEARPRAYRSRASVLSNDEDELRKYIMNTTAVNNNDPQYYIGRGAFKLLMEIAPDVVERFRKERDTRFPRTDGAKFKAEGKNTTTRNNDRRNQKPAAKGPHNQHPKEVSMQYSKPKAMLAGTDYEDDDDQSSSVR
jgi:hypothetical protein